MEDPNRLLRPVLVLGMGFGGQDGAQVGARGGCSPGRTLGAHPAPGSVLPTAG